jgi:hypothetical protein
MSRRTHIDLGLVQVTPKEAADCVKMLIHDAKEFAGQFHGQNRSEKFRTNWPDEYKFASANWKTFMEHTIKMYAELLGRDDVSEVDKHRMYVARLVWEKMAEDKEPDNRLQLAPNTLQFVGDKIENRRIKEQFGVHGNLRAALMNSAATRH